MTACKCVRCGLYWTFSAGPHENFTVVTKWCPTCVGLLPQMGGAA